MLPKLAHNYRLDIEVMTEEIRKALHDSEFSECGKNSDLEKITEEVNKWKDMAYRYAAECENIKKRLTRSIQEQYQQAVCDIIGKIAPIVLELNLVSNSVTHQTNSEKIKLALHMIESKLNKILEGMGVSFIKPKIYDPFNEHEHEIISTTETDYEEDNGKIAEVISVGLSYEKIVIRPAKVVVFTLSR